MMRVYVVCIILTMFIAFVMVDKDRGYKEVPTNKLERGTTR